MRRLPASSTGPRRPRATRSSTSPPSRSDTRSTLVTSSPATAPTSTATSSARGGRCDACSTSTGWSSTGSARPRRCPRSPCCDPGHEAARARRLRVSRYRRQRRDTVPPLSWPLPSPVPATPRRSMPQSLASAGRPLRHRAGSSTPARVPAPCGCARGRLPRG